MLDASNNTCIRDMGENYSNKTEGNIEDSIKYKQTNTVSSKINTKFETRKWPIRKRFECLNVL